jgi:endonuclease/exonuclease/phosphatase family metal-dependent hydrolase
MRITTLNLQQFVNWEARQPAIIDYLQSTSPDIIVFQEVVFLPKISPYNQVQLLNQTLNYSTIHSAITRLQPSTEHETYREGLAALSKFPVVQSDTIILKQAPGDEHNRIVQLLDLEVDGRIIKIANVHFSITDIIDFATAHLTETLEILAMRGEERIIVGDFNLSSLEEAAYLWEKQYRCSTEKDYITFPKQNKRIDYFLIPKAYSFESISTSEGELSDHQAVTVDIKLG